MSLNNFDASNQPCDGPANEAVKILVAGGVDASDADLLARAAMMGMGWRMSRQETAEHNAALARAKGVLGADAVIAALRIARAPRGAK